MVFCEFRSGGCWARLVSGKYRRMLQKKTSILYCIFDFGHFSSKTQRSHACVFRKKCNGHETGVFLKKKIKKVQKKTSTVNSLFLILVIFRQKHYTLMPFFSKKKSNGHESGMFMEKKIIKSEKKSRWYRVFLILDIFRQKHTTLIPVFFIQKNKMGIRAECFWRKKSKKVQSFIG